ncbi:Toll/interleukin-1 receptor domain-containing protein, partial [Tanacetum coccineum]
MFVSKMKKLRWLRLRMLDADNMDAPNCLSNELRIVKKQAKIDLEGLQEIVLEHLPQLKVLRLHFLERLVSTPDFNGLPRLQKLELKACGELEEIHPSLGNHRSLKYIYVSVCSKLKMFPTIVRMEQLESLHI